MTKEKEQDRDATLIVWAVLAYPQHITAATDGTLHRWWNNQTNPVAKIYKEILHEWRMYP